MTKKFEQLENETGLVLESNSALTKPKHTQTNNEEENVINTERSATIRNELENLKNELNLKNEILEKMTKIRSQVESELEDLTASLFEEAHKMVYKANILRDKAEKELIEANMKIDMLTAEVQALKLLVITSTPSKPNAHLQPQLNSPKKNVKRTVSNKERSCLPVKSPSNYELGVNMSDLQSEQVSDELFLQDDTSSIGDIDPIFHEEFNEWRKGPTLEPMQSNFMKRIYDEEIYPVFNFKNKNLTSLVIRSIENNSLTMEVVNKDKLPFPKKCALLETPRICRYRLKMEDERWYSISQLCRNRIAAVCDLFCYLRYIQNGLVKCSFKEMYWQIMKRRRNIAICKLGFSPIS